MGGPSQAGRRVRSDPLSDQQRVTRSVVQSPSGKRSDRIGSDRRVTSRRVTSRQSRVESSDRWGRWSGRAVVGYGGAEGGMGWM